VDSVAVGPTELGGPVADVPGPREAAVLPYRALALSLQFVLGLVLQPVFRVTNARGSAAGTDTSAGDSLGLHGI